MEFSPPYCSSCGHVFVEPEPRVPCPSCGDTRRTRDGVGVVETNASVAEVRARQKRPGFGGWVRDWRSRDKLSLRGIPAREVLDLDRSHPQKTVKRHHVEELRPDGSWETVHEEEIEYEAKRRSTEQGSGSQSDRS